MTFPPATRTQPGSDINHSLGTTGLIVVCKRDGFVEFHDGKTFALQEEIKLPDFPHEVVLSPDRKKAYVSIYGNGQVGTNTEPGTRIAVLDIAGKKLDGFIEVAPFLAPHAMMFDKAGLLWATAESSHALVYIDPARGVVLGHVETGTNRSHFMAANADGSKIYVPHRQLSFMSVIDTATKQVTKRIPDFRYECQGVCTAPDGNRVYQASSARPEISIIDPVSDTVAGKFKIEGLRRRFPAAAQSAARQPRQSLSRRLVQSIARRGGDRHRGSGAPASLQARERPDGHRLRRRHETRLRHQSRRRHDLGDRSRRDEARSRRARPISGRRRWRFIERPWP